MIEILFSYKSLVVLITMIIVDMIWALYIRRTSEGRAWQAGTWSALIFLFGSYVTRSYVENIWYIIPAIVGAFIGTVAVVKFETRKKKQSGS